MSANETTSWFRVAKARKYCLKIAIFLRKDELNALKNYDNS